METEGRSAGSVRTATSPVVSKGFRNPGVLERDSISREISGNHTNGRVVSARLSISAQDDKGLTLSRGASRHSQSDEKPPSPFRVLLFPPHFPSALC